MSSVALFGGVVIACATAHLRPVEGARFQEVEVSGGQCAYDIVPLDIGACFIRELDLRPRRIGQDRLVRCGETAMVCEHSIRCDCAQPRRLFDCEPECESDAGHRQVVKSRILCSWFGGGSGEEGSLAGSFSGV
ncbi:hypothetical protein GCM10012319_71470 [Comamonas sp. KCTC 72670]|nr:hypothetical protein GCM10012319_71470 [Comamonas sp. KCTC 72670]